MRVCKDSLWVISGRGILGPFQSSFREFCDVCILQCPEAFASHRWGQEPPSRLEQRLSERRAKWREERDLRGWF